VIHILLQEILKFINGVIKLLAIIPADNANANDSHVDYHIQFGIDDDYRGNELFWWF
jgi:hypothetical protein